MPNLTLSAANTTISAYHATPQGEAKGGVVVIQEIFGVNPHIRAVADFYAGEGYHAIAPALFDFVREGVELGYDEAGIKEGYALYGAVSLDQALAAIVAGAQQLKALGLHKIGVVGYCWGGALAYHAACMSPPVFACASCYYGGGIAGVCETHEPKIPTILHFGEKDTHIPMEQVSKIATFQPQLPIHIYNADHGFNCDARGSYDAPSAAIARARTLALFAKYIR